MEDFEIYFEHELFVEKLNGYLLHIIRTRKREEKKRILTSFYDRVVKVTNYDGRRVSVYLKNNLDGILQDEILEAKYPGFISKTIESVPYLVPFLDKMIEYKRLQIVISILIRLFKIELTFLDIFKDLSLATNCMIVVGGPFVVMEFFTNFSSFIVSILFASVILPQFLANLHLAANNSEMIFIKIDRKWGFLKIFLALMANMIFSLVSPILIINCCESTKEELNKSARKNVQDQTSRLLKMYRKYEIQRSNSMKIELGLETYYQVVAQIIVLLLSKTSTPTTRGLEAIFDQSLHILGFEINSDTILALSIGWSLKSCILAQLTSMMREKVLFPITSMIIVFLWSLFGALKRILTVTIFFAPSLGLFSLLHHWHAEQIPYQSRLNYNKISTIKPDVKIYLRGMNQEVYWNRLDRWDYSTPQPTPPNYSLYTELSLQGTLFAFISIIICHTAAIYLVKIYTSRNFKNCKNWTNKLIHVLECVNFTHCFEDWDNTTKREKCSVKEYQQRYRSMTFLNCQI